MSRMHKHGWKSLGIDFCSRSSSDVHVSRTVDCDKLTPTSLHHSLKVIAWSHSRQGDQSGTGRVRQVRRSSIWIQLCEEYFKQETKDTFWTNNSFMLAHTCKMTVPYISHKRDFGKTVVMVVVKESYGNQCHNGTQCVLWHPNFGWKMLFLFFDTSRFWHYVFENEHKNTFGYSYKPCRRIWLEDNEFRELECSQWWICVNWICAQSTTKTRQLSAGSMAAERFTTRRFQLIFGKLFFLFDLAIRGCATRFLHFLASRLARMSIWKLLHTYRSPLNVVDILMLFIHWQTKKSEQRTQFMDCAWLKQRVCIQSIPFIVALVRFSWRMLVLLLLPCSWNVRFSSQIRIAVNVDVNSATTTTKASPIL